MKKQSQGLRDTDEAIAKKKQAKVNKKIDKRIEQAYYASCSGVQINIMDIGKVFAFGKLKIEQALAEGHGITDAELQAGLRAFVDTLDILKK